MDAKILSTPKELVLIDQVYQNQRVGHRLKSIKPHTADKDDPKLRAACAEMESLFISHLFKEMRATVEKSDFIDGGQADGDAPDQAGDHGKLNAKPSHDSKIDNDGKKVGHNGDQPYFARQKEGKYNVKNKHHRYRKALDLPAG